MARHVESGLWTQFHVSRRLKFNCCRVTTLYMSDYYVGIGRLSLQGPVRTQATGDLRAVKFSRGTFVCVELYSVNCGICPVSGTFCINR